MRRKSALAPAAMLLAVLIGGAGAGYVASSSDVVRLSDVPRIGEGVSIAAPTEGTASEGTASESAATGGDASEDSASDEPAEAEDNGSHEDQPGSDEAEPESDAQPAPVEVEAAPEETDEPHQAPPATEDDAGLVLVNAERASVGCPALVSDDRLIAASQSHADDMAANAYFSHVSQDGRSFDERIRAAGYGSPGAENIASGQRSVDAVITAWMESPGHRANILNCDLGAVGLARSGNVWVQTFGY